MMLNIGEARINHPDKLMVYTTHQNGKIEDGLLWVQSKLLKQKG